MIGVGLFLVWFGYINFLRGFGSFRMPSMTPIASLYAAIPISGALIALFAFEQLVNGWRNGFEGAAEDDLPADEASVVAMSSATVLFLMTFLFLCFGYMGVPVAFSLIAGVMIGAAFTDVTFAAIVQKMFDGVDSEALLAIPFFLLVGELMSSANVVQRVINLSLTWSAT